MPLRAPSALATSYWRSGATTTTKKATRNPR
jgi:hypothetical protein